MRHFAYSCFSYIRKQIERRSEADGLGGKLMFMMPSVPPQVVLELGSLFSSFCAERPEMASPLIKVSMPLADEWKAEPDLELQEAAHAVLTKGWCDDRGNLTSYRNFIHDGSSVLIVLLLGVDRVTDSASMADFHHCDFDTIRHHELQDSFGDWTRSALDRSVGYDEVTVQRFDWILKPLVERGLADILQISSLLQYLDLSAAQDGRDAEKALLQGLGRFGLPLFNNFRFTASRAFVSYLDDALDFFSYDEFLDDRKRQKAIKTLDAYVKDRHSEEAFEPNDRLAFNTDEQFLEGLRHYIDVGDKKSRTQLLDCDFVIIRDEILSFRAAKDPSKRKEKKETVRKLSGGPVEVALSAVWTTLAEFKRAANDQGFFAHEVLNGIDINTRLFKHDCDGESPEGRSIKAREYLSRFLGGVDQLIEKHLGDSRLGEGVKVRSQLLHSEIDCQSARTAEPYLQFSVTLNGDGLERLVSQSFAWRLPEIQPYRVADEMIRWAAAALTESTQYCLPIFNVSYYEELMLAKDDEETRRVLLQCVHEEGNGVRNLLKAPDLDVRDPMFQKLQKLAFSYSRFIQEANTNGLHNALQGSWNDVRRAYEEACGAYLTNPSCASSPLAALMFRSFLVVARRESSDSARWMWEPYEPSCLVTVLHPALLEMLEAQIHYLITSFCAVAFSELSAPGARSFRDQLWQDYVDLAAIQMPLSGLIKDRNRVLDTDVRGESLIHRIGSPKDSEASLTTRLLLRYDGFEEDDISDTELFRKSRESVLLSRILQDYRTLHPHAEDGLSIAVYQNDDIQPMIAAVDDYLRDVCGGREKLSRPYSMSVTVFTESSDDSSVSRWVSQWNERWEAAENQETLAHYRQAALSISHRIVSAEKNCRQFTQLITNGLEVDVAFLNGFIRAGSQGNEFELVEPYDVRTRTLKFPILEKAFCAVGDPGRRLQRARVLSNRQFRLTTCHAELMARLKNREVPQNTHHVVLGYGDFTPWQSVVDALHRKVEWLVCIDPNVDERLIVQKAPDIHLEKREIIGFGSGVGDHGEANFTISTEQFRLDDVLDKLESAIREVYNGWAKDVYQTVAKSVLRESQHLSGLSLIRATGVGQYVRDFMAYSLTRKLLQVSGDILCDQLVSLDAYQHWFDSADSGTRPDLLWLTARLGTDGRISLDMRLIECKLAKMSDAHLDKAREQLESGIRHLVAAFMPRIDANGRDDERPDERYWWLQLHRLIASKTEIFERDQRRVLTGLERLSEGEFNIEWRAAAVTYWTDQTSSSILTGEVWPYQAEGKELGISVLSTGSEFVRELCENSPSIYLPWPGQSISFAAAEAHSIPASEADPDDSGGNPPPDGGPPDSPQPPPGTPRSGGPSAGAEDKGIGATKRERGGVPDRILLGKSTPGSKRVYWEFGHKELNNRHLIIFGSSGMGKTYTIQCLLLELGRAGQNSLIVDYTNGFFDNQLEEDFKKTLSPLQHIVRKEPLAINPFRQQAEQIGSELLPEVASSTAQRVSGVFSGVYSFGDQQKSAIYQAVKTGLERTGNAGMTLEDLIPLLEVLAEEKGTQAQSASSVISKLRPFLDQNPFGAEDEQSWERLFSDDLHKCHIIQLAGFMKDAARLVTEFSLIDLYWFYRGRGTQASPRVVVLDEVQNLDHKEESPLAQLLREGRKFGFSLILATQIMSNLEKDERDRLFLAGHKLFFRPADTEMRTYAEIAAVSTGEKPEEWMKRLASLTKGECYSLGPSLNETTGKLEVKAFRIKIAPLAERIGIS